MTKFQFLERTLIERNELKNSYKLQISSIDVPLEIILEILIASQVVSN